MTSLSSLADLRSVSVSEEQAQPRVNSISKRIVAYAGFPFTALAERPASST